MKFFPGGILYLLTCHALAQPDTAKVVLRFEGFADAFYAYDFNRPASAIRQPIFYNHNRHNQVNLNMVMAKVNMTHHRVRGNLALHAGTYSKDNYAHEPGLLKHLYEAHAGVAINKKKNVWIDGGIFLSHLGFESAISMDNPTLTRSMVAETSPYYLAGIKVSFDPTEHIDISILICNGWQRIKPVQGNSLPSFGTQIYYEHGRIVFNWSSFTGTDDPDISRRIRIFNNLYGKYIFSDRWNLTTGFDIGFQQKEKASKSYYSWLSPVLILQFLFNEHWACAVRGEYYRDRHGIIVLPPEKFIAKGFSFNVDYMPVSSVRCRMEIRKFNSEEAVFTGDALSRDNLAITGSIAVWLTQ
jgi:hypothetical protein